MMSWESFDPCLRLLEGREYVVLRGGEKRLAKVECGKLVTEYSDDMGFPYKMTHEPSARTEILLLPRDP